jgi:hypothetical protein
LIVLGESIEYSRKSEAEVEGGSPWRGIKWRARKMVEQQRREEEKSEDLLGAEVGWTMGRSIPVGPITQW